MHTETAKLGTTTCIVTSPIGLSFVWSFGIAFGLRSGEMGTYSWYVVTETVSYVTACVYRLTVVPPSRFYK